MFGGTGNEDLRDLQINACGIYLLTKVTDGFTSTDGTTDAQAVIKLDPATGTVDYSTTYGTSSGTKSSFTVADNCEVYLFVDDVNSFTTDGSTGDGIAYVKLNADGSLCAATMIPGNPTGTPNLCMEVDGDTVRTTYRSLEFDQLDLSTDGTFTDSGEEEIVLTKFVFCPAPTTPPLDTLYPDIQTACQNGLLTTIEGIEIVIDGSTFPTIYQAGVPGDQPDIPLEYQWQVSTSPTGPFTDIAGPLAQLESYSPPPTTVDLYYRRITKTSECCGGTIVSTSDVSSVIVNSDSAPSVELPSLAVTCPGVAIDYAPIITGGVGPYNFLWSTGDTDSLITVAPTAVSIYTVTVTDANGCKQIGQAPVQTYEADAGVGASVCDGQGVTIGGSPLPGVTVVPEGSPILGNYSVAYTWSPATGLSCTDCPNPTATPSADETYTLTVTLYLPCLK